MASRSKAWVCGRSLAGIAGSNPIGDIRYLSLASVVCCQVGFSGSSRSLVQRCPTECECVCVSVSVPRCNSNSLHLH